MIKNPCKIADTHKKQFSYRPDNLSDKQMKITHFMTDYTRVNNYLNTHKEELENYSNKKNRMTHNKSESPNNDIPNKEELYSFSDERRENKYYYLQPVMKFAPRTEFERIYDTLNSYNFGKINKNLIKEQLKALGFLTVKNYTHLKNQNEYSLLKEKFKVSRPTLSYLVHEKERLEKEEKTPEIVDLLTNITDIIKINREIIHDQEDKRIPILEKENHKKLNIAQKKIINNYLAKNILGEYQKKTHFKALLNCTLNLDKKNKKYKVNSVGSKTYRNFSDKLYKETNYTMNQNNSVKTIIEKNFVKPFHSKKQYPKEDMEYLKKLCNMAQNEYYKGKNIITESNKMDETDDEHIKFLKPTSTILINGIRYNKNDLPKISKVILKECNYIKNYYDTEGSGTGKTMITRGLSVNEFSKKYGLPK